MNRDLERVGEIRSMGGYLLILIKSVHRRIGYEAWMSSVAQGWWDLGNELVHGVGLEVARWVAASLLGGSDASSY